MSQPTLPNIEPTETAACSTAVSAMLSALAEKRFFKLISGGSLTETEKIAHLARAYAMAGADCLDLAPDLQVIQTVESVLQELPPPHPVIMISLPLDPDPHFRKIELDEPACIQCGLCLPACPTEAITLPEVLEISQSLCYGCGRCVPTCPTEALSLLPFQVESQMEAALSHPLVEAVEIHSHYVDPYMLATFLEYWRPLLHNKLISLCFRIDNLPPEQILEFYQVAARFSPLPVMLQVDGAPMSGNDDPAASRPALEAAGQVMGMFQEHGVPLPPVTISGGINRHTATLLQDAPCQEIAGAGMGTVARKTIWNLESSAAIETATELVAEFKAR